MTALYSKPIEASPDMTNGWVLMRRLVTEYLWRYRISVGIGVVCMAVVAGATAANAWMMEPVLDKLFLEKDTTMLLILPAIVAAIAVIKAAAAFGQNYLIDGSSLRGATDVQSDVYVHLMRSDLKLLQDTASGQLLSNFLTDALYLRQALGKSLVGVVQDSLMIVALVSVMFFKDWKLALVATLVMPLAVFPLGRLGSRVRKASKQIQERSGTLAEHLDTTFGGVRDVKAYGMEDFETVRAKKAIRSRRNAMMKAVRVRAIVVPITEMLGGFAVALVIFYGGSRVIAGELTPGAFFSFMTALLLAYAPLKDLANLNAALQMGIAAAQRLFALLDRFPQINDKPGAVPLKIAGGALRFDDASFGYRADTAALQNVSFEVGAGETVALVGPSGAGKSTVLSLIPRFFDVESGRIVIDGMDIRDVTIRSLRSAVGLVAQDAALFADTIRANIGYGKPDATDEEIEAAARNANAHDFILKLPDGYDTVVGSGGQILSGGQRQRITIARAMLKNAPILLLDEATSALDSEAERKVQDALKRLTEGRTTLVVAHRLSTVLHADRIVVIENGRVAEIGPHAELLAKGGRYADIYTAQFLGRQEPAEAAAGE